MNAARKEIFTTVNQTKAQVMVTLKDTRSLIDHEIARIGGPVGRLGPGELAAAQTAVDVAIVDMERRLQFAMRTHLQRMFGLGSAAVDRGVQRAHLTAVLPAIDTAQVEMAVANSHRLVSGLSQLSRGRLHDVMVRATLARQTPYQAMQQIGDLLREGGRGTPPGRLAAEAERIYRTEGLRTANLANYARMEQLATRVPGSHKKWIHGGGGRDPREHHARMNGMVIPMDQDFILVDKKGRRWKAFGPHDPGLPPGEVINCTCTLGMVLPGFRTYDLTHGTKQLRGLRRSAIQAEWQATSMDPRLSPVISALDRVIGGGVEIP